MSNKKLFRYFPTRAAFDAKTKAVDDYNDSFINAQGIEQVGTPEITWQDICFIENYDETSYVTGRKIYTHGTYYGAVDLHDAITVAYAYAYNVHGVADAHDVAYTLADMEYVVSDALNNHETRIVTLENSPGTSSYALNLGAYTYENVNRYNVAYSYFLDKTNRFENAYGYFTDKVNNYNVAYSYFTDKVNYYNAAYSYTLNKFNEYEDELATVLASIIGTPSQSNSSNS